MDYHHVTVLKEETISLLSVREGGTYVDCTLGGGGHAEEIARRIGPAGHLVGIDQDPAALVSASQRLAPYPAKLTLVHGNFRELTAILRREGLCVSEQTGVDGVVFDLGVSSPQLDLVERGFSYSNDAPLDMRMNPDTGRTAADLLAECDESELARIIWSYGEERWARRIAHFIVQKRQQKSIRTTGELVDVIKAAVPKGARREGPHPARRTFQALRIAVNDELTSLESGLRQAIDALNPGGRVCVISFHSLEDRIVKQTFKELSSHCICPPEMPVCMCEHERKIRVITRKPVVPKAEEVEANPRARSAKLRACERVLKGRGTE